MEFPLKSAFKKNKDKRPDKRNNFFDAKGDGGSSDEYSSANMIYFSEDVIEDVDQANGNDQTEETAFVIITEKMKAAFSAVFSLLLSWVCVDSACNVNLMNFVSEGYSNYQEVKSRNRISTAGNDGHLKVVATFTWGNTNDIKFCPDAQASLFSTRFFMAKRCDVLFTGRDDVDQCKIYVLLVLKLEKVCLVESYTRRRTVDYFGFRRSFKKIWFTATDCLPKWKKISMMVFMMSTMSKRMPQMYKLGMLSQIW